MMSTAESKSTSPGLHSRIVIRPAHWIALAAIVLIAVVVSLQAFVWQGSRQLHTAMEIASTLLAGFVGVLAYVRYCAIKNTKFLLLASGFIGTAFLDGYHTFVTSGMINYLMPSPPESLIPWSWNASRTFLALMMASVWVVSRRESQRSDNPVHERFIISSVTGLTLFTFAFFAFVPLPRAYYPEYFLGRPEELIAATLFAIALFGIGSNRNLKFQSLDGWLVGSLLVGFVAQLFVMSRSFALFDLPFDLAHFLKLVSYGMIAIGMLIEFRQLFAQIDDAHSELTVLSNGLAQQTAVSASMAAEAEMRAMEAEEAINLRRNQESRTAAILKEMVDAVISIDELGSVQEFNVAAERMFGYPAHEIKGQNIKILMPSCYKEGHVDYLAKYMETGKARIINLERELIGLRKDGSQFPMMLSVSEVQLNDGPLPELNRYFTGIVRDLTQQIKAQQDLVQAKIEAENASKFKSEFLANMSHEIRTPMTAILGYADLLVEDGDLAKAPADRVQNVNTIRNNARHLLTIINDILDMSKIEAGKMSVETIEVYPVDIVDEVTSLMGTRADGKGIRIETEFKSKIPETIMSDPTRLRQILMNLVGNAIKFTEAGSITIEVALQNNRVQKPMISFAIRDTGIGMTPYQRDMIARFEAFSQADGSTTRQFGGTGLGLRISNSLAIALGGGIQVESELGKGSAFTATIDTGDLKDITMLTPESIENIRRRRKGAKSKIDDGKCSLEGLRVLLAEDGPDNQRLIGFLLKKAGAEVDVADNGQIAFDMATEAKQTASQYDVILMDMQMPVMDGYSATTALRDSGYTDPIIALTAHAMAEDRKKCIDAGCDDYTTKPIDRAKIIELVNQWGRSNAAPMISVDMPVTVDATNIVTN